jgi:pantoate kinase
MHMTHMSNVARGGVGDVTAQYQTGFGFGFQVPRTRQAFGW